MGPTEHGGNTDEKIGVRELGGCPELPARRLPHIVIVEKLGDIAAPIEQREQSRRNNDA